MSFNSIATVSGKITNEIHLIDIEQYNLPRVNSVFALETPKSVVIMDIGTSNDIKTILHYMTSNGLSPKKIRYLVPSHYHFDHFGGGWALWKEISEHYNPEVKILTTERTRKRLQDPVLHMKRVKRTFGDFIGIMEPLPDEAYEMVNPDEPVEISGLASSKSFQLVATPGHTDDHVCPALLDEGHLEFVYLSEAAGGFMNSRKLVTISSSMPPEFDFTKYIRSLEKLIELKPSNAGYGHFGAVKGGDSVMEVLEEHHAFSYFFRDFVEEKYAEGGGEARYIVEQFIEKELEKRVDSRENGKELMTNTMVALVYGQLIDLGLREPK
ncbi:MAG: MBL fold metallo-hydrolase [Candidatus Odinarchaeota archaeon]